MTMMAIVYAKSIATPMEGIWTRLRNFLRPFRGVHKDYLAHYVAMFEWAHNLKRVTHHFLRILMIPRFIISADMSEKSLPKSTTEGGLYQFADFPACEPEYPRLGPSVILQQPRLDGGYEQLAVERRQRPHHPCPVTGIEFRR